MGLLDGKVALVTGAGGGLGRAHALLMAQEGARVVVNDLGSARDGDGASRSMADEVVAQIKAAGGEAVANYASVSDPEGAQAMIEDAVRHFGRLDVVVNNAGILRDKTLVNMTDEMWDLVQAVHLKGTFLVTRAAVLQMRAQGQGGRIINTSSYAGLKGNFGQANYGAAKAGIAGFTRVVALETRRLGITINCVAPVAKTRMTDDLDVVPDDYLPEDISPLVAWLASAQAEEVTGRVFGAHGRHYFEYKVEMTPGVQPATPWTLAEVGARWAEITRAEAAAAPKAAAAAPKAEVAAPKSDAALVDEAFARMGEAFVAEKAAGWSSVLHFKVGRALAYTVWIQDQAVRTQPGLEGTPRGTISFDGEATFLGVVSGALNPQQAFMAGQIKADNMNELMRYAQCFDMRRAAAAASTRAEAPSASPPKAAGLNLALLGRGYRGPAEFVRPEEIAAYAAATDDPNPRYEGQGAVAPPLMPVKPLMKIALALIADPELGVDAAMLVHGEQDMTFHRHLRPWDLVAPRSEILQIEQKESGQVLVVRQRLLCEGELVNETRATFFIRAASGAARAPKAPAAPSPPREILYEETQQVAADQMRRYAGASGDHNPIHLDDAVARAAGLPSVILHGLCTMAFASRAAVQGVCGGDPSRLKRLKVRFSRPVLPGWTLTTRLWREGQEGSRAVFGIETVNQEGVVVLTQALAEVEER